MKYRKMTFSRVGIAAVSLLMGGLLISQTCFSSTNAQSAAVSKPAIETLSAEHPAAVQELTEMFREALTLAQNAENANQEKGAAMIEAALAQGAEYPEAYAAFWALYRPFLEKNPASDEIRLTMLEAFTLSFEDTSLKCRTRAEFERFWKVQQEVNVYLAELEKKLTASGETGSAENAGTETNDMLTEIQTELKELENERLMLRNEIKKEMNWDEFNRQTISGRDPESTEPFAKGKTYEFMEKIQKFTQEKLETEEFALLMETAPDETFQIRQRVQELLEKGRILNQTRYNLWANFMIYNTPENVSGIDSLSWISPEYLLPALTPYYQEKLNKCLENSRNPTALADNIMKITLTEKVPLSAF